MKIAVSGASGLIGSALVPAREAVDHDVARLVRREPAAANELAWDPDAGTTDAARLNGVDANVALGVEMFGKRWTEPDIDAALERTLER